MLLVSTIPYTIKNISLLPSMSSADNMIPLKYSLKWASWMHVIGLYPLKNPLISAANTTTELIICVGCETPICAGLGSDATGLNAN